MGVQLGEIVSKEKLELEHLAGRKIAIDAFNSLYQFLAIIRQYDGTPLMDSQGRVTSHLSGLLYRNGKLLEAGILPAYVFDGKPPKLKRGVVAERMKIKAEATKKWKKAKKKGDIEEARMYAQQTSKLTDEMIEDSKKLLEYMGMPVVQAPSEGEAQAAVMAEKKDVWASASQDFDSLLFGSPKLIRNLTITGKRKLPRKNIYVTVEPEIITLEDVLKGLGIKRKELVDIGILVGTDYNEGIKGIGPKKALSFIKEGKTLEELYEKEGVEPEVDLKQLRDMFLKPEVTSKYKLKWQEPDREKVVKLLVDKHDFSIERVEKVMDKIEEVANQETIQSRLDKW